MAGPTLPATAKLAPGARGPDVALLRQRLAVTEDLPANKINGDLYEAKRDAESLALSLSSFEELYARDCTYRDVADKIRSVKNKIGTVEGPKVKRLPTRSAEISN